VVSACPVCIPASSGNSLASLCSRKQTKTALSGPPFMCGVPRMSDSFEVQVLSTTRWGEVIAKRKGRTVR
jgi:hypothetical protein